MQIKAESFEHWDTTVWPGSLDSYFTDDGNEGHSEFTIAATYGRDNSAGLRLTTGDMHYGGRGRVHAFVNYLTSCICGVALKIGTDGAAGYPDYSKRPPFPLLVFFDGDLQQVTIAIDGAMRLVVYRGNILGTVLARTDKALHEDTFHYIAVDITIGDVTGALTLYLDGELLLSLTNVDTQSTANTQITSVAIGGTQDYGIPSVYSGYYVYMDDFYVFDHTGTTNNTVLGDVQVAGILPVGDGPRSEWEPSSGTLHSTTVDDLNPPFSSDYVQSGTVGAIDVYRYGTLSIASGTIHSITLSPWASKQNTKINAIAGVVTDGATYSVGSDLFLSISEQYAQALFETNPITASRFNLVTLQNYYFGIKRMR